MAREPAVTKIFSPLMTYSSPSSTAVVDTAAESEPKPGSVMAIAAHTLPSRSSCSSVATPEIAALPRPWHGTDSISATSPQLISITLSTADMLPPLWLSFLGLCAVAERLGAGEGDRLGLRDALEQGGQRVEFDGVRVLPQVVLARDRPQHLGGALVRLLDDRLQLLRQFQIDCHDSTFGQRND